MNNLTETQRAYLAGYIDADGCISITQTGRTSKNGNKCYGCVLRVSSTNRGILDLLLNWTGLGYVRPQPVQHYRKTRAERFVVNVKARPQWRWQLSANKIRILLPAILPYMELKKERALLAMELLGNKPRVRGKGVTQEEIDRCSKIATRMRQLNKRGI